MNLKCRTSVNVFPDLSVLCYVTSDFNVWYIRRLHIKGSKNFPKTRPDLSFQEFMFQIYGLVCLKKTLKLQFGLNDIFSHVCCEILSADVNILMAGL